LNDPSNPPSDSAVPTAPAVPAPPATDFPSLGLSAPILADLAAMNFVTPTPIQAAAIPVALSGKDVIGIAQTGTGKTAAFCLPIIERLPAEGGLRALVLSPTRELTLQTFQCVQQMGKSKGFRAASVIGGEGFAEQNRALASQPAMVVGTPGRVFDQIERRNLDPRNVQILVLDEADRLLDMGFAEQIEAIIRRLPSDRQTLLFTATMPSGIQAIARMYMREPVEVSVGLRMTAVDRCKQELYTCTPREKPLLMKWLMKDEPGQVLVFCRTKRGADSLERELQRGHRKVAALHADRSQEERTRAMQSFRDGAVQVLVATDLASRGLDVDGIARVVNYDVPPTGEDYLHRIGRTARAQREGVASTFATVEDLSSLRSIEAVIKQRIPSVYVKRDDLMEFARLESEREMVLQKERHAAGGSQRQDEGSHSRRPSHDSHSRGPRSHGPRSHDSRSHDSRSHDSHAPRSHAPRSHEPSRSHDAPAQSHDAPAHHERHESPARHERKHDAPHAPHAPHAPAHPPAHPPARAPASKPSPAGGSLDDLIRRRRESRRSGRVKNGE
jgi:ATP-dependent RNA helicase RhlE